MLSSVPSVGGGAAPPSPEGSSCACGGGGVDAAASPSTVDDVSTRSDCPNSASDADEPPARLTATPSSCRCCSDDGALWGRGDDGDGPSS